MQKRRSHRKAPRLGQHFLTGAWAAARLAGSVGVRPNETILEIGAGKGALTEELLKTGARVIAIEKDHSLVELLRATFKGEIASGHLDLVEADIRDFDPTSCGLRATGYVLAANIPYYITGEIIRKFLTAEMQPRALALLVQKEVAERIVARDGKESILSVSVKAYGMPKTIAKVARDNFSPPPSVDSAILLVENISRDFFFDIDEAAFFRIIKAGFASKRKLLARNLEKIGFTKTEIRSALAACGLTNRARAEDVPLEKWKCLTQRLARSEK